METTKKAPTANDFDSAKSNVLIIPKQTPKPAFIYRGQPDLKGLIDWSKIQPKVRISDKGEVILTMGKFDLTENVLITLNDSGKVTDVITLTKANELYNVVASK